jgi:hypothetical protein
VPLTSDSGLRKPFQESNSAERTTQKKNCSRLGGRRAPTAEALEVVVRESMILAKISIFVGLAASSIHGAVVGASAPEQSITI